MAKGRKKKRPSRRSSKRLAGLQRSTFRPLLESLEPRCLLTATVVDFTLETTDLAGDLIQSATYGSNFYLNFYVQDKRTGPPPENAPTPDGVFAAYTDLLYDSNRVALTEAIQFGEDYPNGRIGDTGTAGEVDELGAFAGIQILGDSRYLLARLPMKATGVGTASFTTNAADILPLHDTLTYGSIVPVPTSEIAFGTLDLEILNPAIIMDDGEYTEYGDMNYDGYLNILDVVTLVNFILDN